MARTLYFPDGSMEVVLCEPQHDLRRIIDERLGRDCAELYDEIIDDFMYVEGDDYEKIADGYFSLIQNTKEELEAVLKMFDGKRLDRNRLQKSISEIYKNLHKNT